MSVVTGIAANLRKKCRIYSPEVSEIEKKQGFSKVKIEALVDVTSN